RFNEHSQPTLHFIRQEIMLTLHRFSICTAAIVIGLVNMLALAQDRPPQGVPDGVEKPLLIAPRPDNGRNSEGDFIQLKDGRLLLIYTKFIGTDDHAPADLAGRYSSDGGQTWES